MTTATLITGYLGYGLAANRPVTPSIDANAIAFYYATDSAALSQWTGAAWVSVGGGGGGNTCIDLYTPPTAASFTAFSGDGTTPTFADVASLGMVMSAGGSSASDIERGGYLATAGAHYTVTARLRAGVTPFTFRGYGLAISDGTKLISFGFQNNAPLIMAIIQFSTFGAATTNVLAQQAQSFEYLRIKNDGTNRTYYVSQDGQNWALVFSEATGTFLTETKAGIVVRVLRSSGPAAGADNLYVAVPYWSNTSP